MSYKYNPLIPHNLEKIPKASEIKSNGNSNVQDDLDDINERLEDLPYVPQLTNLEPFPIALGRIFQWQGEDDETVQVTDLDGDTTYIKHGYFYKKTNSEDGIIIEHGTPYLTINENITYNNEILVKAGTYYKKTNGLSFRNGTSSKDGYKFLVIGINSLIVKNNIVHKVISIEDTTDFSLTYKTYTLDNGETFISQGQGFEAPYQWVEFINDDLDSIFLGEQSVFNPQVAGSGAYLNIAINENNLVFSGWHNIQGTRDEHTISQPALIRMNTQPRGGTQIQSDWNQTDSTAVDFIKNKPTSTYTPERVLISNTSGKTSASSITANELGYLAGMTGSQTIQTALNGKASSSHTHTKAQITDFPSSANSIIDYGNNSTPIFIGYSGAGATISNLSHIAGYLNTGNQIKDVSKSVLKEWIGSLPASDVYAWAKASSKPSYSWSEINGKPSTFPPDGYTNLNQYVINGTTWTFIKLGRLVVAQASSNVLQGTSTVGTQYCPYSTVKFISGQITVTISNNGGYGYISVSSSVGSSQPAPVCIYISNS